MATGQLPWTGREDVGPKSGYPLMLHIANSDATPSIPSWLPAECIQLTELCVQRKPSYRPTAQFLTMHKFFQLGPDGWSAIRRLSADKHVKTWDKLKLSNYLAGIKRHYNNMRRKMLADCCVYAQANGLWL